MAFDGLARLLNRVEDGNRVLVAPIDVIVTEGVWSVVDHDDLAQVEPVQVPAVV